jgi:hypothetical protein
MESNSELSVLASSQFISIDDIGLGQGVSVELGNVEISGTQGDSIGNQDHGVDSSIQGIEISPRRTWSGKVVKYRDG